MRASNWRKAPASTRKDLEEVHVARVVWIALVCIVVGVGIGGAWRLWQYWQLYSTLAKLSEADDLGEPLRPDGRHLAAIRKLRFMSSFDIDMAAILGLPRPVSGGQFDPALWRLYTEMLPALQAFVEHGQIAVGQ
jgi:hypothetical protein